MKENLQMMLDKKYLGDNLVGVTFADNLPRNFVIQEKTPSMARFDFSLDNQNVIGVLKLSSNYHDRIFSILTTALFSLLYNLGNKDCDDFLIWCPIAPYKDTQNGCMALTVQITSNTRFKNLLIRVSSNIKEANQYARHFDLASDNDALSKSSVAIVFENIHLSSNLMPCDMKFIFSYHGDKIQGKVEYNQAVYLQETISRIILCFNNLMHSVLEDTNVVIGEVSLLSKQEQRQLTVDFNQTQTAYPREQTIISLFHQQVAKTSQKTAVIFKERCFSYQEINQKSNQLARRLRQVGVTRNSIVALLSQRSCYIVIGMLAILKAGGAYLPIDPVYPKQRIQSILEDSKVSVIVAEKSFVIDVNHTAQLIDFTDEAIYTGDDSDLEHINYTHDLANVIYTSGSSGNPKGVMVEHGGFLNYINWCIHSLGHNAQDVSLQLISFAFDAFACNLFPSILTGGATLILSELESMDFPYIRRMISQYKVTNTGVVPAMYQALLDVCEPGDLTELRFVQLAGDKTSDALIEKSWKINPHIRLINVYGPTENTVATTAYFDMTPGKNIVIGKPIYNNKLFVLGRKKTLMPIGFCGELCISGEGLARGYLNDVELSAEKFMPNPYLNGAIMYCSGDLVRWLSDGNLEFIGRIDQQVKIRGLRIEVGEIENYLMKHNEVKEAVVIKRLDARGNDNLYAYIVAQNDKNKLTTEHFHNYLSQFIPDYMLPSYFVILPAMPLNPNGKVDRKQLPDPHDVIEKGEHNIEKKYIAPRNETEQIIHDIWCEVLGMEKIGVHDNFFYIGGHSLKATQVASRILFKCNINIDLAEIFKNPILEDLAASISLSIKNSAYGKKEEKEYEEFVL